MGTQLQVEERLQKAFEPLHLEVINESHMHDVPAGSELHMKVLLVTEKFRKLSLVQRHRAVNGQLADLLASGELHALALHTMTPEEWFEKGGEAPDSPPCFGGGARE